MKWLIWEYMTGGGMIGQALPWRLALEGWLMVKALATDLAEIPGMESVLLLDRRLAEQAGDIAGRIQGHWLDSPADLRYWLDYYAKLGAGVWPIAPESDNILAEQVVNLRQQFSHVQALDQAALAVFSDKWASYRWCLEKALPTPETVCYRPDRLPGFPPPWVVKPRWGVGCEGMRYLSGMDALNNWAAGTPDAKNFLLQPYIAGEALSLSVVFNNGHGELITVNRQQVVVDDGSFSFAGVHVNCRSVEDRYLDWLQCFSQSFSGLHGYLGIDFIKASSGDCWLVDINPRLTTAYAGIREAVGVNIAAKLLHKAEPILAPRNHGVVLTLD